MEPPLLAAGEVIKTTTTTATSSTSISRTEGLDPPTGVTDTVDPRRVDNRKQQQQQQQQKQQQYRAATSRSVATSRSTSNSVRSVAAVTGRRSDSGRVGRSGRARAPGSAISVSVGSTSGGRVCEQSTTAATSTGTTHRASIIQSHRLDIVNSDNDNDDNENRNKRNKVRQQEKQQRFSPQNTIKSSTGDKKHNSSRNNDTTSSSSSPRTSPTASLLSSSSSIFSGVSGVIDNLDDNNNNSSSSNNNNNKNNNTMLAAESFQRAYDHAASKVIPRFETFTAAVEGQQQQQQQNVQSGQSAAASSSSSASSPTSRQQQEQSPPFVCGPITSGSSGGGSGSVIGTDVVTNLEHQRNNPFVCIGGGGGGGAGVGGVGGTGATVSTVTASAVQHWTPVAKQAAGKARNSIKEFAVIAAEVYRQECRSDHRGDDAAFFVQQQQQQQQPDGAGGGMGDEILMQSDQHSLMENQSLHSGEQRDEKGGRVSGGSPTGEGSNSKSSDSSRVSKSRSSNDLKQKLEKGRAQATATKSHASTPDTTATTHSSCSRGADQWTEQTPDVVDRKHRQQLDTRTYRPSKYSPYGQDDLPDHGIPLEVSAPPVVDVVNNNNNNINKEADDLRTARMELFQTGGPNEPETQLARAMDDLNRQDVFIHSLRRQMQITQESLDATMEELAEAKITAKERQFKATEMRARAVQEKKRLEDLYIQEVEQGKKLHEKVSQLQTEVSTLKASLRTARSSTQRKSRNSSVSPVPKDNNAQLISLKAEIVDLRSQLAEAHAASIADSSALHTLAEIEELKKQQGKLEDELSSTRHKLRRSAEERERLVEEQNRLVQKLQSVESTSNESKARLEENLMIAMKSADDVRAELVKTKANLQRLERERSRARLQSSPDVVRLNADLTKAREESKRLQQEVVEVRNKAKADREAWFKEMEELREKLQSTNQETLSRSADRLREQRRLHDEVSRNVSEIKGLKQALRAKGEELDAKSVRLVELEYRVRDLKILAEEKGTPSSEAVLDKLKQQLREMQAREITVVSELRLQKSLLDEARRNPADPSGQLFLAHLSDGHIEELRARLERLRASKTLDQAEDGSNEEDIETSLKEEISNLKQRLTASSPTAKPQSLSETEARLIAMEQAFMNEIAVLKAKLSEAQSKIREEAFRAQEERRINRESESDRLAELEQMRQERDNAQEAKSKMESEVAELRRRWAQLSIIQPPRSSMDSMGTHSVGDTTKKEFWSIPKGNVKRLRDELAQARDRLAAARENSRSSPPPTNSTYERSPMASRDSISNESNGSSWGPPTAVSPNATQNVPLVRNVSLLDGRGSKKASLDELTRQLEASRKRLQTADQRLNGLVNDGGSVTIVRTNRLDSTFDGSIDEVVNTSDGGIEVSHRRYADI